jgi:hypothetical protein
MFVVQSELLYSYLTDCESACFVHRSFPEHLSSCGQLCGNHVGAGQEVFKFSSSSFNRVISPKV